MTLKAKEEKIEEAKNKMEGMKKSHEIYREETASNNEELLKQFKESEEQREQVEHQLRDL